MLKRICRLLSFAVIAMLAGLLPHAAAAQTPCNPRSIAMLINHLQTGQVQWQYFAPQVVQAVAAQTNNTGFYPQLAALGSPRNVYVLGSQPVPNGIVCGFRSEFDSATLDWQLAYGPGGMIYGLWFTQASAAPNPSPDPRRPTPPVTPGGTPSGSDGGDPPRPVPQDPDEACKLYPNLC